MSQALDQECLKDALINFKDARGRGTYTFLQDKSGVTNIGRYARGDKVASFDTWLRLHSALPDEIPAPCYKADSVPAAQISTGDNNRLVQTSSYVEQKHDLPPEALIYIRKLVDHKSPREFRKLIAALDNEIRENEKL